MADNFYNRGEGFKILDEEYWPKQLLEYRGMENKYLLEKIKNNADLLLDVGCGKGKHLIILKDKFRKLIGIDYSDRMIEIAKSNIFGIPNIHIVESNIKDFETEEKFDYILCMFNTFGNMNEETQTIFLNKAEKFLKQDGILVISVYSENAKDMQVQFYKNIGLIVSGFDKDFVYTNYNSDEFKSERFSKEKIQKILSKNPNLKINNIMPLNEISYIIEIKKH